MVFVEICIISDVFNTVIVYSYVGNFERWDYRKGILYFKNSVNDTRVQYFNLVERLELNMINYWIKYIQVVSCLEFHF